MPCPDSDVSGIRNAPGFTLIELLSAIAIIGVLVGIMIPVVGAGRKTAEKATCVSNMRQLGVATQLWLTDNDDVMYPHSSIGMAYSWFDYIRPYIPKQTTADGAGGKRRASLYCPSILDTRPDNNKHHNYTGYGRNGNLGRIGGGVNMAKRITDEYPLSRVVLFWDDLQNGTDSSVDGGWPQSTSYFKGSWYYLDFRHDGSCHVLFLDGHVEPVQPGAYRDARDFPKYIWNPENYPNAPLPQEPIL